MAFFKKTGNLSGSVFILFRSYNRTFLTRFTNQSFQILMWEQYHRASSIYINNDYTDVIMPKNMTPNSKHGADKKTQKTQNDQTLVFHNIR